MPCEVKTKTASTQCEEQARIEDVLFLLCLTGTVASVHASGLLFLISFPAIKRLFGPFLAACGSIVVCPGLFSSYFVHLR